MRDLLTYLAGTPVDGRWCQWQIQRLGGSANNILYRATSSDSDLAVKFTIRDARSRARREYNALLGLDRRLAACPPDWRTRIQARYNGYVRLAAAAL